MLPHAYEFHWDPGHVVFLGIFYSVLTAMLSTLAIAAWRHRSDLARRRAEAIEWHGSFEDLPAARKRCRHEFDGGTDGGCGLRRLFPSRGAGGGGART